MNLFQAARGQYEDRLQRARYLATQHPFAAEFLNFYQSIAQFQKSLYNRIAASAPTRLGDEACTPIRESFDATLVLPHFRAFLDVTERSAPAPLADSARQVSSQPSDSWIALLSDHWRTAGIADPAAEPFAQFIPRAFLQPYAEFLAEQQPQSVLRVTATLCPLCSGSPLLGVIRREGDGGKRFLLCSFCSQEWEFRRILCPACGEQSETKLPVYVAEQFPHIRIEACETCHSHIRAVDLTTDGHAIPLIDDLAALPLTLWAVEHNYTRSQPNLLGT
ncbi:MAG: formate dehydrogenase accessory protein FdhE [Candidatus Acidiferrum sp.]|jgi:FdhE protein